MRIALATTFLFLILANISAQTSESNDKASKDNSTKFGINMGLNYSNAFAAEQLPEGITNSNGFGFRLEILAESRLFKQVFISPKMGFSFSDSSISIERANGEIVEYLVYPIAFEVATHFQFKKDSPGSKPYFYIGPSVKVPIEEPGIGATEFGNTWTPSVDVGMSWDKDFGYFQFAPEFRYSLGLRNVNENPVIGKIYYHNFSLIFNFLG